MEDSTRRRRAASYPALTAAVLLAAGAVGAAAWIGLRDSGPSPIVPDARTRQLLHPDALVRIAAPAELGRWQEFPSRTCQFAVPVGWRVVWADLDRGAVWHNEARSAAGDLVACDVAHRPQLPATAARLAAEDTRAAEPGAAHVRVQPLAGGAAVEYRNGSRTELRLFLGRGVELDLEAATDRFEGLRRGLIRSAPRVRPACRTGRSSGCLVDPAFSP